MRVTKRKRKTPLGKSKNSTYVARIRKSQNNTNTKNTNDKRLFDHHAHRVVVVDRSSSSSSSNSSNGTGSIHCARARAFWSSQTKSLNFLKCLVLVSIFENLQKYDLLFSLFLGGGSVFFVSLFFFHERKGKSGGVVAEKARDTSVVFAPDVGPRAMREQSVRCVLAFAALFLVSRSLVTFRSSSFFFVSLSFSSWNLKTSDL